MSYKVLNWNEAIDIKDKMNGKPYKLIDFNFATIYLLDDGSYLIMPLNPFGNSLQTDKNLFKKWIDEQYFPSDDLANKFYFDNKYKIDNLLSHKELLKEELCNYAFNEVKEISNSINTDNINNIYEYLKRKRKLKKYKLNFISLAGDFILQKNKKKNWRWGLSKDKQLLNPVMSLILITNEKDSLYFDIEDILFGKWGYPGMEYVTKSIHYHKANEITEIINLD